MWQQWKQHNTRFWYTNIFYFDILLTLAVISLRRLLNSNFISLTSMEVFLIWAINIIYIYIIYLWLGIIYHVYKMCLGLAISVILENITPKLYILPVTYNIYLWLEFKRANFIFFITSFGIYCQSNFFFVNI